MIKQSLFGSDLSTINMYKPEEYYAQFFYSTIDKMKDDITHNVRVINTRVAYTSKNLTRRKISKEEFLEIYHREDGENQIEFDESLDYDLYLSVDYKDSTLLALPYKLETSDEINGHPWRKWMEFIPQHTIFIEEYIRFNYDDKDELVDIHIGSVDCLSSSLNIEYYISRSSKMLIFYDELVYGHEVKNLTNLREIPYYKNNQLITENKEYYYNLLMTKICEQLDNPLCSYIHDNHPIIRNSKSANRTNISK